jgi:hypothetical protein
MAEAKVWFLIDQVAAIQAYRTMKSSMKVYFRRWEATD